MQREIRKGNAVVAQPIGDAVDQETEKERVTFFRVGQPHKTGEDADSPICELRAFG